MNIFKRNNTNNLNYTNNNLTFNIKKILNITTLCPLNIGNGEEYNNTEYYIEDGNAKIIDMDKLMESINDMDKINQLTTLIKSNMGNGRIELTVQELYNSININIDEIPVKEIKCNIEKDRRINIKKFINQNGKYYVPGSSIKGAIRTAYIFDYYDKNINKLVEILHNNNNNNRNRKNVGKEVVKEAIGPINKDFFKYLLISDSPFIDESNFEFINTHRYNIKKAKTNSSPEGNKEPKEVLVKNCQFNMQLTLKKGFPKNIDEIKNMCNKLTNEVIKFELENEDYLPKETVKFYKNIQNNLNDGNIYLTLGSGSGFLSKTIYLLLKKHNKDLKLIKEFLPTKRNRNNRNRNQVVNNYGEFPRTRVICSKTNIPMGWIKISVK